MYKTITLNIVEQELAKLIAKHRQENNARKGFVNHKQSDRSDWDIGLEGSAGEIVACKYFDVYPDTTTELQSTQLPEADLITKSGIKVDVKTVKWDKNSTYNQTMWSSRKNARKQIKTARSVPDNVKVDIGTINTKKACIIFDIYIIFFLS